MAIKLSAALWALCYEKDFTEKVFGNCLQTVKLGKSITWQKCGQQE